MATRSETRFGPTSQMTSSDSVKWSFSGDAVISQMIIANTTSVTRQFWISLGTGTTNNPSDCLLAGVYIAGNDVIVLDCALRAYNGDDLRVRAEVNSAINITAYGWDLVP